MARATPTAGVTELTDWESADVIRYDKFRDQILQIIEFLLQTHDHTGDAGDGGTLTGADFMAVLAYGPRRPTWS